MPRGTTAAKTPMINSIRARLTCWYVGILTVVLGVFSSGVYVLSVASLYDRLDSRLASVLQVAEASLEHEIEEHEGKDPGEDSFRLVLRTVHQTSFALQGLAIYDGTRLVAAKPGVHHEVPTLELLNSQQHVPPSHGFHVVSIHGDRFAYRTTYIRRAATQYLLITSESQSETDRDIASLRRILLLAIPAALLISAAGGYLLARKSLSSVLEMSMTVERITQHNLDQRVEVSNPNDELGQLASTFNRLLERLQQAFDSQRQFMADASHELRTPLSVVQTATQVTLEKPHRSEEEYRDALNIIEQQMRRLVRVVEQMFLLARADAGALRVERSGFYLDELLMESVRAAAVLAHRRGVHVQLPTLTESPCSGDEALLRQAFLILLDNAVKYTPAGGHVWVTLADEPQGYCVRVFDTGCGITAEAATRIFERFYRVDKARSRSDVSPHGAGAGLGLAIARWIADAHQGTLILEHSEAGNTCFALRIPEGGAEKKVRTGVATQPVRS